MEGVAEIQVERPILAQRGPRFGLDGRARFGLAADARGEAVGALAFGRAIDRDRTIDAVAAAIERDAAGAIDEAEHVAIGVDAEHQYAAVHAIDALVDGGKPLAGYPARSPWRAPAGRTRWLPRSARAWRAAPADRELSGGLSAACAACASAVRASATNPARFVGRTIRKETGILLIPAWPMPRAQTAVSGAIRSSEQNRGRRGRSSRSIIICIRWSRIAALVWRGDRALSKALYIAPV